MFSTNWTGSRVRDLINFAPGVLICGATGQT